MRFSLSFRSLLVTALFSAFLQYGCVHNVPLKIDNSQDIRQMFPVSQRVHARVGVYLSENLRHYIFKQQKMGMTFQMESGKYLEPISMQMISAMFDEAVEVNSLPPYIGQYTPDVDAVIQPELLYVYGNAKGTLSGQIEAKVRSRVRAYDLSGRIVWQGEAMGESRSDQMDFITTFLGNLDKVGKVGYQAALVSAQNIVKDFDLRKPPELYALQEAVEVARKKDRGRLPSSDAFEKLYAKGMYNYEKKNFPAALYSFRLAHGIDQGDPFAQFYGGLCFLYTGQRTKAMENLKGALVKSTDKQLSDDCNVWMKRLNDPLKMGIVFVDNSSSTDLRANFKENLLRTFAGTEMYTPVLYGQDIPLEVALNKGRRDVLLDEFAGKGAKIVIFINANKDSTSIEVQSTEGDRAREFRVNTGVQAYGTGKKKLVTEFAITEMSSYIGPQESQLQSDKYMFQSIASRSVDRLILGLLENQIF